MSQLLLFAQVLFFWTLSTASHRLDLQWSSWGSRHSSSPIIGPASRVAGLAVAIALAMSEVNASAVLLIGVLVAAALGVFALRPHLTRRGLLAELELTALALVSISSWILIARAGLSVNLDLLKVGLSESRLAVLWLIATGVVLAIWQSGNVVRGALQKTGVMPPAQPAGNPHWEHVEQDSLVPASSSSTQLRHGRLIGYLERILIIVLVVEGSYEGLGFLVAAKGLVRAREFEEREQAEYFLFGTLLSVVCGLFIGLGIRHGLRVLW